MGKISGDVLALVGDYYHDGKYIRRGIESVIGETKFDVRFVSDPSDVEWDSLDGYDLFLLAKEGKIDPENSDEVWMDESIDSAILRYVEEGGGILALHSALANYPVDSHIRDILRGHFVRHPREHPEIHFSIADESHPVVSGVEAFSLKDEQYFVDVDEENTVVFLSGLSEEYGESPAGWAHEYGEGRACCVTPGHKLEVLEHPALKGLLENTIEWTIK